MRGEGADLEPTNSKHSLSAAMSSEFLSSHFTFDEASSCCLNYKNSPMLVQREKREEKKRERRQSSFTLRSYEVCIINFIVNFFLISQNLTRGNLEVERSKRWKCAYESKILAISRVNAFGIRKFRAWPMKTRFSVENFKRGCEESTREWKIPNLIRGNAIGNRKFRESFRSREQCRDWCANEFRTMTSDRE